MDNQQPQSQSSQPPQDFYSERSQRANKKMIAVVVIVSALSALGVAAYQYFAPEQIPEQIACTQDAKQCPDGSYVFRQAPNCGFAACPQVQDETAGWQIYRNMKYGVELKYPKDWFSQQCGDSYIGFSYNRNKLPVCFTDSPQPHINIKIFGPETGLDIYTQHTENSLDNSVRTAIKIGEISATKVVGATKKPDGPGPLPGLNFISVMFDYKGNVYDFYYYGLDNRDYSKIFDQILSTIKFTPLEN